MKTKSIDDALHRLSIAMEKLEADADHFDRPAVTPAKVKTHIREASDAFCTLRDLMK